MNINNIIEYNGVNESEDDPPPNSEYSALFIGEDELERLEQLMVEKELLSNIILSKRIAEFLIIDSDIMGSPEYLHPTNPLDEKLSLERTERELTGQLANVIIKGKYTSNLASLGISKTYLNV